MTFGSCFSGIGILDLAFIRLGWKCLWRIENHPQKIQVLKSNLKDDAVYYGDILQVNKTKLPKVNLIVGGPPCQDLSVSLSGSKLGFEGKESKLAITMSQIIDYLQPEYFVMENVPKLLKLWHLLEEMGYYKQYESEKKILKASDFGGYTRRERAFIVGHIRTECRRQILYIPESNKPTFQTRGKQDVLPMCLPWKGGVSLERLGACVITESNTTKTNPIRTRKSNGNT